MGRLLHAAVMTLMLALGAVFALLVVDFESQSRAREVTYLEFRRLLEYDVLEIAESNPLILHPHSIEGRYRLWDGSLRPFRTFIPGSRRAEIRRLLRGKRIPVETRATPGWMGAVRD